MNDDDLLDIHAQLGALTLALRALLRDHPEIAARLLAFADSGDLGGDQSDRAARNAIIYRDTIRDLAGPPRG